MKPIIDIPNNALPIASRIKAGLNNLQASRQIELLDGMSKEEFIDFRVELYLSELETAILSGQYSSSGCEEIAEKACLEGIES